MGPRQTVTTTSTKISGLISQMGIAANAKISAPADTLLASSGEHQHHHPQDGHPRGRRQEDRHHHHGRATSQDVLAETGI